MHAFGDQTFVQNRKEAGPSQKDLSIGLVCSLEEGPTATHSRPIMKCEIVSEKSG